MGLHSVTCHPAHLIFLCLPHPSQLRLLSGWVLRYGPMWLERTLSYIMYMVWLWRDCLFSKYVTYSMVMFLATKVNKCLSLFAQATSVLLRQENGVHQQSNCVHCVVILLCQHDVHDYCIYKQRWTNEPQEVFTFYLNLGSPNCRISHISIEYWINIFGKSTIVVGITAAFHYTTDSRISCCTVQCLHHGTACEVDIDIIQLNTI